MYKQLMGDCKNVYTKMKNYKDSAKSYEEEVAKLKAQIEVFESSDVKQERDKYYREVGDLRIEKARLEMEIIKEADPLKEK